jgi:MOSC domain-containing protein YiiM
MTDGADPDLRCAHDVEIVRLVASPVHRYGGRPGEGGVPPAALDAHDVVFVRAGLGIVGDRFYAQPAHRRASITVMSAEAIDALAAEIGGGPFDAALARRNVVVRGVDADRLVGQRFSIDSGDGPVELQAHRPARPCAWMDAAFGPGAQRLLRGHGGVRCEPLTSGSLRVGPAVLRATW